ncbi:hypothetical protein BH23BAC3_BH23BAC3_28080 [soil metagenome]
MNQNWIIAGVLFICSVIILNLSGLMKGSATSDFSDELKPEDNPLQPCPESPNCISVSRKLNVESRPLFDILPRILAEMNAEKIKPDSQILQIDAVFRIPVFGFRDDVSIRIESGKKAGESVLYLSSRSRVGRGDFGVNRRRLKSFLRILNNYLN